MKSWIILFGILWTGRSVAATEAIHLFPGYVTRIHCEGRLLVSAVGNDALVRLEALPSDIGCGVLLKPSANAGRTNLILETSTGTAQRVIEIHAETKNPGTQDLNRPVRGDSR